MSGDFVSFLAGLYTGECVTEVETTKTTVIVAPPTEPPPPTVPV
jgi:hypothetical protein